MRFYWAVPLCIALLLPQGLARNVIDGKITIQEDGILVFEGYLERDDLNITYAALNYARDTPIETAQSVYVVFNGTELAHPPANYPADLGGNGVNDTGYRANDTVYYTVNSYNISLSDYLALRHKGFDGTSGDRAFLERRGDSWYFGLHLDDWIDVYNLIVEFPNGAEFEEISTDMSYERFGTSLHFRGTLVEAPRIDVIYSIKPKAAGPTEDNTIFYILTALIAITAAALLMSRRKKRLNEGILQTLNEKERLIITALCDNGGKLTQTRLRQKTGLPKSTLSLMLRDLENRKLVSRFEHGSTWDIELDQRVYR